MTEDEYRRTIAHERALGMAYVNGLLNGLCRDLGYPARQWSVWQAEDRRARAWVRIQASTAEFSRQMAKVSEAFRAVTETLADHRTESEEAS